MIKVVIKVMTKVVIEVMIKGGMRELTGAELAVVVVPPGQDGPTLAQATHSVVQTTRHLTTVEGCFGVTVIGLKGGLGRRLSWPGIGWCGRRVGVGST